MIKIAPSTLSCPEENVIEYVKLLQAAGADYIHCDITDGKFVKTKSMPAELLYELSLHTLVPLDVHLMVEEPLNKLDDYIKSKPIIITVHYEAFKDKNNLIKALQKIRKAEMLAGICIQSDTEVSALQPFLPYCDLVLLFSGSLGYSGGGFDERNINRLQELNALIAKSGFNIKTEMDGGINADNIHKVKSLNLVVMGNAIFKAEDRKAYMNKVRMLTK